MERRTNTNRYKKEAMNRREAISRIEHILDDLEESSYKQGREDYEKDYEKDIIAKVENARKEGYEEGYKEASEK